jgi:hypothetical protein
MKKISSKTTYFRKKIIPIILLINILMLFFGFTIFDFTFKNLAFIFFPTVIFLFVWIFKFRKLEVVFLGNKYLEVNDEKILFENIISINKKSSFCYKLTYQIDDTIKSIIFMVDSFPTYPTSTPNFVKEIREFVEKNEKK